MKQKAVVLLSGGQDSTTCLFWALENGYDVHALSIHYGQKHSREIEAAEAVVDVARRQYPQMSILTETVEVGRVLIGTSPLVNDNEVLGKYESVDALPGGVEPTFVPGRNLLFLVLAANRAASVGATCLVTGVCEEDFGGYFDCRRKFIDAAEVAIAQAFVGLDRYLKIHTPLMFLTKAESVKLARSLPGCWDALAVSHTCYAGERPPCGKCHACHLRARGFAEAGELDPLFQTPRM